MKTRKLFVETRSYEKVTDFLGKEKINWQTDATFHFDFRTALIVFAITAVVAIIIFA
jgi:hypothetical protein